MSKLLLLDGHSLAYRAFYALPTDLATSSGQVTNAVYGFTSMLIKVVGDEHPDHLAVAFDTAAPTFRKEKDATYKAGRKETPDLFKSQLPLIRQVLDALAVPVLEVDGVEADDVIATLAERAAGEGMDVIVVTGDRDSYQLVRDPHIRVLYNKRGVSDYALYDEAGIVERTGVTSAQYPEYAALRGDTSDNLPGVPGIGEKTAAKLVNAYGNLEGIFEHLEVLPPKQRQNLAEFHDQVFHNREMSILEREVPVEVAVEDLHIGGWDHETVKVLFQQLEFRTLYPRLLEALGETDDSPAVEATTLDVDVERVSTTNGLIPLFDRLADAGDPAVLEADWLGAPGLSALRGLAIASGERVVYAPADLLADAGVRRSLGALVGPGGPPLVTHRAKELMHALHDAADVTVATLDLDTALMAYLVDPGEGTYDLGQLVARFCGIELVSPDRAESEGTLDLDGDGAGEDAGRRAAAIEQLAGELRSVLEQRELWSLYTDVERPLVPVLAEMEQTGVRIDREFLDQMRAELQKQCNELETRIHEHAGEPFVVNSVPQLRRILFEVLELTPVKKTKTGPSTDADSLQKMAAANAHPILADLLRYREVEKLRSTYADALPPLIHADGRIHATFNQLATTTGRISSESPNLQNIPVRTAEGREMRRGVRSRRRRGSADGRLLADRAAHPRPSGRGPGTDRGVRTRRRRAHDHRVDGVPRRGVLGRRLPASLRQGRELRARVRHGGLRARATSRHPDRSGQGDPGRLLRVVPERARIHGADSRRTRRRAGTRRPSSAGADRSPSSRPTTSGSARWESAWRRTRPCRVRRPTSSSWR